MSSNTKTQSEINGKLPRLLLDQYCGEVGNITGHGEGRHWKKGGWFIKEQAGFRREEESIAQACALYETLIRRVNDAQTTSVAFVDIKKAYDSVQGLDDDDDDEKEEKEEKEFILIFDQQARRHFSFGTSPPKSDRSRAT
jgi:hypothetical protein